MGFLHSLVLDGTVGFTVTGQAVTMTNDGSIAPTAIVPQALGLLSDGGSVKYVGSGSVINGLANGNGLVANASGVFSATGGDVTINATGSIQGTEAIVASSNFAGNVTVQTSGNVTAQQDPNVLAPQFAIEALTENGTSKVTVDAGTVTGGIHSLATVNGASIVTVNGGVITSTINSAIDAHTLNGQNQVVINGGTLSGAAGVAVVNAVTDFTGTGGVSVVMHGGAINGAVNGSSVGINAVNTGTSTSGVIVTTDLGSSIAMNNGNGTGIFAQAQGTTGGVVVTSGGTISSASIGIDASLTNNPLNLPNPPANNNNSDVVVHVNNSIDAVQIGVRATTNGTGNVVVDGAGTIGGTTTPSQFGINATNTGAAGGVSVTGAGVVNVTTAGTAILAQVTNVGNAGNVLVSRTGAVTGGLGIDAETVGGGTVTVNAHGGVTGLSNNAVVASGTSGAVTVDTTGGLAQATGNTTIFAGSSSGNILVKTDDVKEFTASLNGIHAVASTTGTVTVETHGTVTGGGVGTGTGIRAGDTGTGAVTVTASALVSNFGVGIVAGNAGTTGAVTVTAKGGITSLQGSSVIATGTTSLVTADTTGGTVTATGGDAIIATSTSGGTLVKTDSVIENTAANNGINATATSGPVTVQVNGTVAGGSAATGIIAANTTGTAGAAGLVSVTVSGRVTGGNGIDAGGAATVSPVSVTAQGGVTAGAGFGIRARGTTGAMTVDSTGGLVQATGGDGVIVASTTGAIQVTTAAVTSTGGSGINATSTVGGITVNSGGAVVSDVATGIIARQTGAAAGGNVSVLPQSTVSGVVGISAAAVSTNNLTVTVGKNVTGTAGNGIVSVVSAGTANINVNNVGTVVTGSGAATSGAFATTAAGGTTNVNVTNGTLVTDTAGTGVTANATGSGISNINNTGKVVGAGTVANAVISIGNATGVVTINNLGPGLIANNATATAASNSALAIATSTPAGTGANNINNSGSLIGGISLAAGTNTFTNLAGGQWIGSDGAAIFGAFGGGSTNTLANNLNATIFAGTTAPGSVANFTGIATVANAGTFYAGNSTTSVTNVNPNAATAQTVTNTGVMNVNGTLNFANLGTQAAGSTFTNGTAATPGKIDMSQFIAATAPDGTVFPASTHATSDKLTLGTTAATGTSDLNYHYTFGPAYNYTDPQSSLLLDTNIGPPGSASDRLVVSGTATGKTAITLWDTSTGAGGLNLTGITLAAVNGASSNAFFLYQQDNPLHQIKGTADYDLLQPDRGPMGAIKKGFFFDPLLQDTSLNAAQGIAAGGSRYALFGLPDVEAFQLPIMNTAIQSVWNETTLTWLDRQDELRNWMRRGEEHLALPANLPVKAQLGPRESTKPGVWMKALGSWTDRSSTRSFADILPAAAALGDINLDYNQRTFGIIGGVDAGGEQLFTATDAVVLTVMGGYLNSTVNFKQAPTSFKFSGGTVGGSLTYMNGGFFADGLVKADFLNVTASFPTLADFGITAQTVSGTNFGGVGNVGYRWDLYGGWGNWYVEPIATVTYVRSHIGDLVMPGLTANFGKAEAGRAALGVRVGNIWIATPRYEIDTSLTAKAWDQFTTQNGVLLDSSGLNLTLDDRYAKTFGEITEQVNLTSKSSGWSAFMNSGLKFNREFLTVTAKSGVRYQW